MDTYEAIEDYLINLEEWKTSMLDANKHLTEVCKGLHQELGLVNNLLIVYEQQILELQTKVKALEEKA